MAGEIAGVNYNAMNDDFLAQMYFNRNAQNTAPSQQTQNVPASQTGVSNPAFQGGPQGDTFEKSSSLVPTVATGILGGGAAAGAGYYFANPVNKNGEVAEGLIKAMDKINKKEWTKAATEEILGELKKPTFDALGIADQKTYDAVKKFAQSGKLESLTDAEKALIPDLYKTQADAKSAVDLAEAEFKKIDMKKVAEDAKDAVSEFNLEHNTKLLQKQKTLQSQISLLADNASEADLEKLIKENKSLFKLKGTEDEIAAQVKELAKTGKVGLADEVKGLVGFQEEYVKGLSNGIKEGFLGNYDKEAKALVKDAPECLQKAVKNFKWKQAGIWGAIAAGTIIVLGSLFGGGSKNKANQA